MVVFEPRPAGEVLLPAAPGSSEFASAVRQTAEELLGSFRPAEFALKRRFGSVNALAGEISRAGLRRLLRDPRVLRVDLDVGGVGHLDEARPLATIDAMQTLGYTGKDVVVAVLDSGYDTDHADLQDDLLAESCFCSDSGGCCPGGSSTQFGAGSAEDDNGHGTNVSGIITSKGTIAPTGSAPDSDIVAIKVLDSGGSFCCSSDVVAGLDWILDNRPEVDLVNMSLGTFARFAGDCDGATAYTMAFATAINTLRVRGVTVFASSGNNGSGIDMGAPACIANALSVGAVWDANVGSQTFLGCTDVTTAADQVTCFSNSDSETDLFAPGAFTTSTGLGGGTSTYGGTSQASPLAASCAALLLDKDEDLTPGQIETALESSSTLVTDTTNGLSFPRVDCWEAGEPCGSPLTDDVSTMSEVLGSVTETACETLIAGPYPIGGSGIVLFRAGKEIKIQNGFSVASGGEFAAETNGLLVPTLVCFGTSDCPAGLLCISGRCGPP
jgi:subtilisin family serine protease